MEGQSTAEDVGARLEYLRGEIRAERISYGELAELESLAGQIEPGDVELLQWANVPEEMADRPNLWARFAALTIEEMIEIVDLLDGFGIVSTDDDLLRERLGELGLLEGSRR